MRWKRRREEKRKGEKTDEIDLAAKLWQSTDDHDEEEDDDDDDDVDEVNESEIRSPLSF